MVTQHRTVDWLTRSLGAFVALTVAWVIMNLLSRVINPLGIVSLVSALLLLFGAVVALAALAYMVANLYLELD